MEHNLGTAHVLAARTRQHSKTAQPAAAQGRAASHMSRLPKCLARWKGGAPTYQRGRVGPMMRGESCKCKHRQKRVRPAALVRSSAAGGMSCNASPENQHCGQQGRNQSKKRNRRCWLGLGVYCNATAANTAAVQGACVSTPCSGGARAAQREHSRAHNTNVCCTGMPWWTPVSQGWLAQDASARALAHKQSKSIAHAVGGVCGMLRRAHRLRLLLLLGGGDHVLLGCGVDGSRHPVLHLLAGADGKAARDGLSGADGDAGRAAVAGAGDQAHADGVGQGVAGVLVRVGGGAGQGVGNDTGGNGVGDRVGHTVDAAGLGRGGGGGLAVEGTQAERLGVGGHITGLGGAAGGGRRDGVDAGGGQGAGQGLRAAVLGLSARGDARLCLHQAGGHTDGQGASGSLLSAGAGGDGGLALEDAQAVALGGRRGVAGRGGRRRGSVGGRVGRQSAGPGAGHGLAVLGGGGRGGHGTRGVHGAGEARAQGQSVTWRVRRHGFGWGEQRRRQ